MKQVVISLARRKDRRREFLRTAGSQGFEFSWFTAIDGKVDYPQESKAGARGCLESHKEVLRQALVNPEKEDLLICEDDAVIQCTPENVDFAVSNHPDTDVLFLFEPKNWCVGTWAYFVPHTSIEKVLRAIEEAQELGFRHLDQIYLHIRRQQLAKISWTKWTWFNHAPRDAAESDIEW